MKNISIFCILAIFMASCTKEAEPQMETVVEKTNTELYSSTSKVYTEDNLSYALVTLSSSSQEQLQIEKEKLNNFNVVIHPDKNSVDNYIKEVKNTILSTEVSEEGTEKMEPVPGVDIHFDFTNILENDEGQKIIMLQPKKSADKSTFLGWFTHVSSDMIFGRRASVTPAMDGMFILNHTDVYDLGCFCHKYSCTVKIFSGSAGNETLLETKSFYKQVELFGYENINNISGFYLFPSQGLSIPTTSPYSEVQFGWIYQ